MRNKKLKKLSKEKNNINDFYHQKIDKTTENSK